MKCPKDEAPPFDGCSSVKTWTSIHVPQRDGTVKVIPVEVWGWECNGEVYLNGNTINYLDRCKLESMGMGNAVMARVKNVAKYVLFDGIPEYGKEAKFRLAAYDSPWQLGIVIAGSPIEIIGGY